MLNSLGADRSPKGRQVSMYSCFFHFIARRWRSAGWTGSSQKALLTSIFASIAPWPIRLIWSIAASTVIYFNEHNSFGITALILLSAGWERSTVNLHLLGWWFLGMTPKRLMWACGSSDCWNGPATRPRAISSARYLSTVSGCWRVQLKLRLADFNGFSGCLKPIWKPTETPVMKKLTRGLLGWSTSASIQLPTISGDVIAAAVGGTLCWLTGSSCGRSKPESNHNSCSVCLWYVAQWYAALWRRDEFGKCWLWPY